MAGQTKKQPIDIESKAAIIGRKLKRLCKKCADHNKWVCAIKGEKNILKKTDDSFQI